VILDYSGIADVLIAILVDLVCVSGPKRLCVENILFVFGWRVFEELESEELDCFFLLDYIIQPSFAGSIILLYRELTSELFLGILLEMIDMLDLIRRAICIVLFILPELLLFLFCTRFIFEVDVIPILCEQRSRSTRRCQR